MFPISSKQPLSFAEIVSYWGREIKPAVSFDELLDLLGRAWWRGDLNGAGADRTDLLRALYQLHSDRIVFAVQGLTEPPQTRELPDGSVEVSLWRVPLPNPNPDSWNDENCANSFKAVAEFWDCNFFPPLTPIIGGLKTAEQEFTKWISSEGYPRPSFWAFGDGSAVVRQPAHTQVASVQRESIATAVEALFSGTVPAGMPVSKRDDAIRKWQRDNNRAVASERTLRRYFAT